MERLGVYLAAVNVRWWNTGFYMEKSRVKSRIAKLDFRTTIFPSSRTYLEESHGLEL